MLTSVAVIKERLNHDKHVVPIQDEETAAICIVLQIVKLINARDMWTWIETQLAKNSARNEKKRNSNLKQSMPILFNNYNMQFVHLPSSCANL